MKGKTAGIVAVALMIGMVPRTAAADGKRVAGWLAIAGGAGMMAASFDYHDARCRAGYTTHRFTYDDPTGYGKKTDTICVSTSRFGSDTYEADGTVSFERPGLMWGGVGAMVGGAVLLALPKQVSRGVQVSPMWGGWFASKTFRVGK